MTLRQRRIHVTVEQDCGLSVSYSCFFFFYVFTDWMVIDETLTASWGRISKDWSIV